MIRDPASADLSTPGRLEALVSRWSAARGASVALADARGDWTWRDLEHGRKQLAELLLTLGVRAGDRVMVVGENCAPLLALFAAAASVHAWFVPVDARRSPRSLDAIRAHASPRRVLFLADDCADARDHAQRVKAMRISLGRWGTLSVSPLEERCVPEPYEGNAARDPAVLAYRCDALGAPRAVMLTHASLAFVARVMAELRGIGPEDRLEASIPVSRCAGLALWLAALSAGAQLRIPARLDAAQVVHDAARGAVTLLQATPALLAAVADYMRREAIALPALRQAWCVGAVPEPAAREHVEAALGVPLRPSYGLAEASSLVTQARSGEQPGDGSAGYVLPGVALRIVDGEGHDVAPGATGEILVRGPNVMKGYYRDPAATAAVMRGGWLATGDRARLGADGACFLEGRVAAPPAGLNEPPTPADR